MIISPIRIGRVQLQTISSGGQDTADRVAARIVSHKAECVVSFRCINFLRSFCLPFEKETVVRCCGMKCNTATHSRARTLPNASSGADPAARLREPFVFLKVYICTYYVFSAGNTPYTSPMCVPVTDTSRSIVIIYVIVACLRTGIRRGNL